MDTHIRHKYVRERPNQRVLIIVPLFESIREPPMTIKNATIDNF